MLRKSFGALAAIALLAGSSAAVAQSAQSLSLANSPGVERAGATAAEASELNGRRGIGIYIIGAIVLAAIVWGVIELTGDDGPSSP